MNVDEVLKAKRFFENRLRHDFGDFVDAICTHNTSLAFEFVKLAYAVGVKDGIIEAYSKELTP